MKIEDRLTLFGTVGIPRLAWGERLKLLMPVLRGWPVTITSPTGEVDIEVDPSLLAASDVMLAKVQRLDAVILKLEHEINLCVKLRTAIIAPQDQAAARTRYLLAERILKIAKGESDEKN